MVPHEFEGLLDEKRLSEFVNTIEDFLLGRVVGIRLNEETPAKQAAASRFLETVINVSNHIEESRFEEAIAKLADVILPDDLAEARGAIALDNLHLRDRFVAETAPLTSVQVSELSGYQGNNPYATAARWKKANAIFSVTHRGNEYFPSFQFLDGKPHPTIKKVLKVLPDTMSAWQKAFWFVSTNGWLDDRAPAEMLNDAPAVLAAAEHEREEVVG
jgi:hypothetical protein